MFEAYRQKCSAEDLSRLKAALCSGKILSCLVICKHCHSNVLNNLKFFCLFVNPASELDLLHCSNFSVLCTEVHGWRNKLGVWVCDCFFSKLYLTIEKA